MIDFVILIVTCYMSYIIGRRRGLDEAVKLYQQTIDIYKSTVDELNECIDTQKETIKNLLNKYKSLHTDVYDSLINKLRKLAEPFYVKENGVYLLSTQDVKDILEEVSNNEKI